MYNYRKSDDCIRDVTLAKITGRRAHHMEFIIVCVQQPMHKETLARIRNAYISIRAPFKIAQILL